MRRNSQNGTLPSVRYSTLSPRVLVNRAKNTHTMPSTSKDTSFLRCEYSPMK